MAGFAAVPGAGDLREGEMRAFDVHGTKIAVANVEGAFHAFDDTCTHMACSLAEGDLEERTVICPCQSRVKWFQLALCARARRPRNRPAQATGPLLRAR